MAFCATSGTVTMTDDKEIKKISEPLFVHSQSPCLQITKLLQLQLFTLQVSELFGGLEICSLAVLVGKDGKELILKASDCTFPLIGRFAFGCAEPGISSIIHSQVTRKKKTEDRLQTLFVRVCK